MLAWLKANGASDDIIGAVSKLAPPQQVLVETPKDPWRAFQSVRDKLRAIESQVLCAEKELEEARVFFDAARTKYDDICTKQKELKEEHAELQCKIAPREIKSKLRFYDKAFQQLQSSIQYGIPDDEKSRKVLYDIILNRKVHSSANDDCHVLNSSASEHEDDEMDGDECQEACHDQTVRFGEVSYPFVERKSDGAKEDLPPKRNRSRSPRGPDGSASPSGKGHSHDNAEGTMLPNAGS